MTIPMRLRVDARSPIPIRWQLSEQLKHVIEAGGVPRDQALPSIRELAGFLGINPNTVARAIEDLKHNGYVEARRGKGVFVTSAPPPRPPPTLREDFLKDTVIRAAALGMTPDDVAVGVLSLAGVGLAALRGAAEVLLVECSAPELDFFGRELQAHLPVRVAKVLLKDLAATVRRQAADESLGRGGHQLRPSPGGGAPAGRAGGCPCSRSWRRRISRPSTAWPSSRRERGWAWSPAAGRPLTRSSTRSPPPPSRTSRGSRRARPRGGAESARATGGRIVCSTSTAARVRGLVDSDRAGDRRRPCAQPARHPDARGHPGATGWRPPVRAAAARPEWSGPRSSRVPAVSAALRATVTRRP